MSAQGDLVAYLDRAITERETAAHAAVSFGDAFPAGVEAPDCVYGTGVGGPYMRVAVPGFDGQTEAAVAHFALYGPESVLSRCAADRRLIELHAGRMHSCPAKDETGYLDEWTHFGYDDACPALRLLAEGYGWTEETSVPDPARTPPTDGDQVT